MVARLFVHTDKKALIDKFKRAILSAAAVKGADEISVAALIISPL